MKLFCLFLALFILPIFSYAQKAAPARVVAELTQLERDIGQANIRRDKAFFERVEADEFVFIDSSGGVTTKAEDVGSLDKPAGEFQLISYNVSDVQVRVYGK